MILNFVMTILDRPRAEEMIALCAEAGSPMTLTLLGRGTATNEQLDLYGLESAEKAVVCAFAGGEQTAKLLRAAKRRLFIDIPGNGIMLAIPLKSVGGGKTLSVLTGGAAPDTSAAPGKFEHELITVIANEGHTDEVMDAARSAGAAGGTVLHAKGTGAQRAEKFLGVSLADEKELIIIVSRASEKAAIMKAIASQAGPGTRAGAVCFSLPITAVAGLRMLEDE